MLGLLSFALVLAATVLLVLGLLDDDGLSLIYASMVCSATAAVVLIVARRHLSPIAEVEVAPAATPVAASPLVFPIADYDDLTAGQILPLLPQLYTDEIGIVEARERATKSRPEILDRLAELRGGPVAPGAAVAAAPPEWGGEDDSFPIDDYESLTVAQIRLRLPELDAEELILVRDREVALRGRLTLLADIDRLLGKLRPAPPPSDDAPEPARPSAVEPPP